MPAMKVLSSSFLIFSMLGYSSLCTVFGCEEVSSLKEIEALASERRHVPFCSYYISSEGCNGSGPDKSILLSKNNPIHLACAEGERCFIECPGRHFHIENPNLNATIENVTLSGATSSSIWTKGASLVLTNVIFNR
jgi:hypothetical protein